MPNIRFVVGSGQSGFRPMMAKAVIEGEQEPRSAFADKVAARHCKRSCRKLPLIHHIKWTPLSF